MVSCQAHPVVRSVAKGEISRAAANMATDPYIGQITMTPMTVRRSAPKVSAQNKLMLYKKELRMIKRNAPSRGTPTPIPPTTTVKRM